MLLVQGNTLILATLSVHLSRVRFVIVYLIYHSLTVTITSTVLLAYVGLLWTPPSVSYTHLVRGDAPEHEVQRGLDVLGSGVLVHAPVVLGAGRCV